MELKLNNLLNYNPWFTHGSVQLHPSRGIFGIICFYVFHVGIPIIKN
jgi:hypothetical protein